VPSGPVSGDASGRCSGLVVHTLGRWRSTEVARPGPSRKARAARRRKRRMDRVEHDLNDEQWTALKAAWGGCAYCGAIDKPLQRDCVLALSRGGRYTLDNIAPACGSCNASKCNEEVTGWLRRKRLDERAFLLRHLEINATLALRFGAATQESPVPD
jgi:5-methylcytosine-specific restriction endonuclease McrA